MSNLPPQVQQLIDSQYGETVEHDHGEVQTGFHTLSFEELEAMGQAERERLGLERIYQFVLEHQATE